MRKEYRSFPFEIKAYSDEEGTFEGYASVYGNVDAHESVFEKGAFSKTLKENRSRVKILWQHNPEEPIGKPLEMKSDVKGLWVRGKISDTTRGRDALTLLRDKVITELSIGFDTIIDGWKDGVRRIKEVRLWEFSPVTWASNDMAAIFSVRQRFTTESRDFDSDFDEMVLKRAPYMLTETFQRTMDNLIWGMLEPQEKYEQLHQTLNQFDERFAQWIEDAYAAMSQRAFVFVRETKSLPATEEPVTQEQATPEAQEADDEAIKQWIVDMKSAVEGMRKIMKEV